MGRPELWRDELASWSFASRPGLGPDRERPSHRRHPAGLLPAAARVDRGVRGFRRRDAHAVRARHGGRGGLRGAGRQAAGRSPAGLAAGLVFALVPSVSRFAQEIRFYALAVLIATLATLLLLRALDRPSARRAGWPTAPAWPCSATSISWRCRWSPAMSPERCCTRGTTRTAGSCGPARRRGRAGRLLPLVTGRSAQARAQFSWIARPGLDLTDFAFFGRNLFYSTSVAAGAHHPGRAGLGGRLAGSRVHDGARDRARGGGVAAVTGGVLVLLLPVPPVHRGPPGPSWPGSG